MLNKYSDKLEFSKVLDILASYSKTSIGKKYCLNLKPITEKNKVQKALDETNEAVLLRYKKGDSPIYEISKNIEICIKTLNSNSILSISDILALGKLLKLSNDLKNYFFLDKLIDLSNFPNLYRYFDNLYINSKLESKIFSAIIDNYTLDDHASDTLYAIRMNKRKLEQEIKTKLNKYISSSYSKFLQEPVITIRNERYVIPVKEEYKSQIKGFIHDISNTGSTVFIEPLSVFELNSKIINLTVEENIEIEKILATFTNKLSDISESLENNIRIIALLDFIFSKANYSISIDATKPIINNKKEINLIKARHPLIPINRVVPIDINLGISFSTLVITGPNTGGKTVSIKTVGLLILMGMCGLNIPAKENSSIFIFDNIFADIGDEQSIQESLSTFSSHILNIIEIIRCSTSNSLILLDELGSGTDPIEGSSLAISILEYLYTNNVLTLATTHYPEVKNYALVTKGFENASQEFDIQTLSPTYRLLIGIPGNSNAFAISKKLGLPQSILNRANDFLSPDSIHIEDILKNIYSDKIKIEKEKDEITKKLDSISELQKSLETNFENVQNKKIDIINNAKLEAREILYNAKDEATNIIRKMKKISNKADSLKDLDNYRNRLNISVKNINTINKDDNTLNMEQSINVKNLKIGMEIFVKKFMNTGILLSLPNKNNEVQVQIGSLKSFVPISEITLSKSTSKSFKTTNKTKSSISKSRNISTEINVIGQTVEDAIFIIDKYLDDCYLARLETIRIIHGKGTGKLRAGIQNFLKKNPHVKSFRNGTFGEGEMGATIVSLK